MNVTVHRILAGLLATGGVLVVLGFAIAIALVNDRSEATADYGSLAGLGAFAVALAAFWLLATRRSADEERLTLRLPPLWLSLIVFAALVGAGFGLRVAERADYLAPFLAVAAFVAVTAFFLRLVAGGLPGKRLVADNVLLPGLWGALLTPVLLIMIQGAAVVVLVVAALSGFVTANPDFEIDPNLNDRISAYLDEMEASGSTTELPDIIESPTIAVALASLVAVIAPLSEELLKALGAIFLLSRRSVVTRADAFVAGAAAGLGFGVIEGIGYTLGSPADWQQMILVRAPVVAMHIAATTIVTLGWYRYRETGRGFLPYFAVGTALHAGWNAMAIGFVYALSGIEEGVDPSAAQAAAVASIVLLLGALFVGAIAWLLAAARYAGRGEQYNDRSVPATLTPADPLAQAGGY